MKIAIPTNDKDNLFKRSERTKGFLILNVDNFKRNVFAEK